MTDEQEMLQFSKGLAKIPKATNFLVLDDMDSMQVAVAKDIKRLGFTGSFYGAKSIDEAKDALEKYPIHFVFCDWNLQNGEIGIDFLKHVRQKHKDPKFPVVMFTTEDEVSNILEAVEAGASGYVVKPWEVDELKEKIAHAWNEFVKK